MEQEQGLLKKDLANPAPIPQVKVHLNKSRPYAIAVLIYFILQDRVFTLERQPKTQAVMYKLKQSSTVKTSSHLTQLKKWMQTYTSLHMQCFFILATEMTIKRRITKPTQVKATFEFLQCSSRTFHVHYWA